jgi:hypothetical protein
MPYTYRGKETFDTHVWMLNKLLECPAKNITPLQLYVIAACFPKMLTRVNNSTISMPFLESLKKISNFEFSEISNEERDRGEKSDLSFLTEVVLNISSLTTTPIPNLTREATAAAAEKPYKVYSQDTCMEFHQLLCELLTRFHESLNKLKSRQTSSASEEVIMKNLRAILALGMALKIMARGAAIEKHLKVIAHLLQHDEVARRKPKKIIDASEEDDVELRSVQPFAIRQGQPLPLWKAYRDWLRLLQIHFDAIEIVAGHLNRLPNTGHPIDISIRILAPSLPDHQVLPWKELLRNKKYFPEIAMVDGFESPSVEDIINFLDSDLRVDTRKGPEQTKGTSIDQVMKSVNAIATKFPEPNSAVEDPNSNLNVDDLANAVDATVRQIDLLKIRPTPVLKKFIQDLTLKVESLKDTRRLTELNVLIEEIIDMLETLQDNSVLDKRLRSLARGDSFTASRHCEACVAAYLNSSKHKDLLGDFAVSYIFVCSAQVLLTFDEIRKVNQSSEYPNGAAQCVHTCSRF